MIHRVDMPNLLGNVAVERVDRGSIAARSHMRLAVFQVAKLCRVEIVDTRAWAPLGPMLVFEIFGSSFLGQPEKLVRGQEGSKTWESSQKEPQIWRTGVLLYQSVS